MIYWKLQIDRKNMHFLKNTDVHVSERFRCSGCDFTLWEGPNYHLHSWQTTTSLTKIDCIHLELGVRLQTRIGCAGMATLSCFRGWFIDYAAQQCGQDSLEECDQWPEHVTLGWLACGLLWAFWPHTYHQILSLRRAGTQGSKGGSNTASIFRPPGLQ